MKSQDKPVIPYREHVPSMYRRTHNRRSLAFAVIAVIILTTLAAQVGAVPSRAVAARAVALPANSWNYTAELNLGTSAASQDALGYVGADLSSDGHTAIVGALQRTVAGRVWAGAAEIFRLSGNRWTLQAELNLGKRGQARRHGGL
jgi:hypothetical protein